MTIIAMDIQPQRCFTCAADYSALVANAKQTVYELNKQALFAHRRVLVQNFDLLGNPRPCLNGENRQAAPEKINFFNIGHLINAMGNSELLPGLPEENRYDYIASCGSHTGEHADSALFGWLEQEQADTIIIGGLPLEEGILNIVQKLAAAKKWRIVVNLAASHGYSPESALQAILKMRRAGAIIVANANELPVTRSHAHSYRSAAISCQTA